MPFKLLKPETFRQAVTIESVDEKGRTAKEVVHCTFLRPNESDLDEYNGKNNQDVLEKFLKNVEGMVDETDTPVPYEGDYKKAFLNYPPATFACAAAFWQGARMGRAKN